MRETIDHEKNYFVIMMNLNHTRIIQAFRLVSHQNRKIALQLKYVSESEINKLRAVAPSL